MKVTQRKFFSILYNVPPTVPCGTWTLFLGPVQVLTGQPAERVLEKFREYVALSRTQGRRRFTLWVRTSEQARVHKVCPVVWSGPSHWSGPSQGPGWDAIKVGQVHIDKLESVVIAHMGMIQ